MNQTRWILFFAFAGVLLLALGLYIAGRPRKPDSRADVVAAAFLNALDAGDAVKLKELSTLSEKQLFLLCKNRESLGARSARRPLRRELLRQQKQFGAYFEFESAYENAPKIRETLTVFDKVASARQHFVPLPRPVPKEHYPTTLPEAVQTKILLAAKAYDEGNRNFFNGISMRDTGWIQPGVFNRIMNFRKQNGIPKNRTIAYEARWEKKLPGALGLEFLRVVNRTSYERQKTIFTGEEHIYFVFDGTAVKPQWDVYAFEFKAPQRITVK